MKLQNNKGNALSIIIIVVALFTIFVGTIFMQINNQIKSNKNILESTSAKYAAEAGIENAILEVIKQIEYKTNNYGNDSKTYYSNPVSTYDDYGKIKESFISAYNILNNMSVKNIHIEECIVYLNNIITTKYTSSDNFISDSVKFKLKYIHAVATETNLNSREKMIKDVYKVMDYINSGLILLYDSSIIHNGDDHGELEMKINTSNKWWITFEQFEIYNKFISDQFVDSINEYKIENIKLSVENGEKWNLKNDVESISDNVNKLYYKDEEKNPNVVKKLNEFVWKIGGSGKLISYLQNGILYPENEGLDKTSCLNYLVSLGNSTVEGLLLEYKSARNRICKNIDTAIKNISTQEIEKEFYELYLDYFSERELQNDEVYSSIETFLMHFETVKKNLAELKCKLGGSVISVGGNITPPENDGQTPGGDDNSGENGQTPEISIEIELDKLEENLENNTSYEVNKIDKTPLVVEIVSNKINTVDDLELEIVSKGVLNKKEVTRKATVVFKTTKEDGEFVTNYSIINYSKD